MSPPHTRVRSRRRQLGLRILVLAILGTSLLAPGRAQAWGRVGHRAAALAAWEILSPAARAAIQELLEQGETLADASTWADDHRRATTGSGPWHYVNVPIDAPGYSARYCDQEPGCVVSKLEEFRRVLADRSRPRSERQFALRMALHLVQDLHQPLHVGDRGDRGGNDTQVRFFDRGSNLHRVWDIDLVERIHPNEQAWLADVRSALTPGARASWSGRSVIDWANESHSLARKAYSHPADVRPIRQGDKLDDLYLSAHGASVRERLAQSAARTAELLESALRPPSGTCPGPPPTPCSP